MRTHICISMRTHISVPELYLLVMFIGVPVYLYLLAYRENRYGVPVYLYSLAYRENRYANNWALPGTLINMCPHTNVYICPICTGHCPVR
jgi:hypothetical protein